MFLTKYNQNIDFEHFGINTLRFNPMDKFLFAIYFKIKYLTSRDMFERQQMPKSVLAFFLGYDSESDH